nr:hypothetical protein BHI3_06210 [Bacteriovorax sp. HI3]
MFKLIPVMLLFCSSLAFATPNEDMISYVKNGYEDDLVELLETGKDININYQDAEGLTALHYAALYKRPNIVKILTTTYPLSALIDYNVQDKYNQTSFYIAIRTCNECVSILLDKKSRIDIELGPITPLLKAVIDKNEPMATLLISIGANTDVLMPLKDGSTEPLIASLIDKRMLPTLKEFLKVNTNLNVRFGNKYTALILAAAWNSKEVVKTLVEAGANLNLRDANGNTALHHAAKNLDTNLDMSLYEYLIERGAKIDLANSQNLTPSMILSYRRSYLENYNLFFELLNNSSAERYEMKISQNFVSKKNEMSITVTVGVNTYDVNTVRFLNDNVRFDLSSNLIIFNNKFIFKFKNENNALQAQQSLSNMKSLYENFISTL